MCQVHRQCVRTSASRSDRSGGHGLKNEGQGLMGLDARTRWEDMSDPEPQNSIRPGKPLSGKRTSGMSRLPHPGHRASGGSGKRQIRVSSREGPILPKSRREPSGRTAWTLDPRTESPTGGHRAAVAPPHLALDLTDAWGCQRGKDWGQHRAVPEGCRVSVEDLRA